MQSRCGTISRPGRTLWSVPLSVFLLMCWVSACADTRISVGAGDGDVKVNVGGRIQFDGNLFDSENPDDQSTLFFRRAFLTISGTAMGWEFRMTDDLADDGGVSEGMRDVYLAHDLAGGKLKLGQFKPYRGMEELTSSAHLLMMERPAIRGSGIYHGAEFVLGAGYERESEGFGFGVSAYNLRRAEGPDTDGAGGAVRLYWAPWRETGRLFHMGVTGSFDNAQDGNTVAARVRPAGAKGQTYTVAVGDKRTAYGLELAGQLGDFLWQSEFTSAVFGTVEGAEETVDSHYLQAAWILSGTPRQYRQGVFRAPGSQGGRGAVELTARYDFIENTDVPDQRVASTTLGINWFVNKSVLFMLNATIGDDLMSGDRTRVLAGRAQINF